MQSYCVKCRKTTPLQNAKAVKTKNNKYILKGTCPVCGGKKSTFISRKKGEGLLGKILFPSEGKVPVLGDIPLLGALF